ILREYIKVNIKHIKDTHNYPILLFSHSTSNLHKASITTRVMKLSLSSCKSHLLEHLATGDPIRDDGLRGILISEAVIRYSALSIKIPWTSGAQWKLAEELVKFYSSCL
ncbi:Hypothetical protein FKW44_004018, partial [Caligus rogercresseyi]